MEFHFHSQKYFSYLYQQQLFQQGMFIFVTVVFMFGINTSSISLSPVRVSYSNATVLSQCLLSLGKSFLSSFIFSDSVYDVIFYIICQSHKEM
jgi:hypothetical protein